MECAAHPGKDSVGYCKRCGSFGCEECLTKVLVRGAMGKQSKPTEALICRDCLGKIRPDLAPPEEKGKHPVKKAKAPRTRQLGKRAAKPLAVSAALVFLALAAWSAVAFLPRINLSHQFMSAEEVATDALEALTAGNTQKFLSCVDVKAFMCRMDSTGLTSRDYEQADGKRRVDLEALHGEFLAKDLLVTGNLRKKFQIVGQDINDDSASLTVKPWIAFGNKLYKRILLEKKTGQWKISGLTSPDY